MRIYKEENKNQALLKKYLLNFNFKKLYVFLLIFFIGGVFFAPIGLLRSNSRYVRLGAKAFHHNLGILDKKYSLLAREVFLSGDNLFGISQRYLKSIFNQKDTLGINLSFKNYKKISNLRNKAMKEGILVRTDSDKVKGYISYKDKKYPASFRLKGDWTDHLLGEKWSFRVETKSKYPFNGMREFSLQHPRTRSYHYESILHKLLKYEKLPYLRYEFLPVSLNGKYLGTYALEEHFGKELIENSGFREGPIIKISDQDKRNEFKRMSKIGKVSETKSGNYINTSLKNADIQTFNLNKISKSKEKTSQFQLGASLFNEYLRGNLKASDVFDIPRTAKYFALTDLLQAIGANTWYDMRFYFDPITARLIPIGYDAQIPLYLEKRILNLDNNTFNLFDDPLFYKEYLLTLNRITNNNYLEDFLESISSEVNEEIAIINKSFPFIRFFREELIRNRDYIKNRLSPLDPLSIKSIKISKDNKLISLKLFNKTKLPIEIKDLIYEKNKYKVKSNTLLLGKKELIRPRYKNIDFLIGNEKLINSNKSLQENLIINEKKNSVLHPITLSYKIMGSELQKTVNLNILGDNNTSISDPLISKKETLKSFNSLKYDKNAKEVYISNDLTIDKPLILPKEYKLIISPGTRVYLKNEGLIIVKGPLIMKGEETNKIYINSLNGGKGILVLNSSSPSIISYSIFNGLRPNTTSSNNVTGGLSFYNSNVEIYNSEFINSLSEDALNLVNSPFLIKDSYFSDTFSDGIDVDFSNGKIQNSSFNKIGNDAIDISGAEVSINNIKVTYAGDKGISIGERSNLYAKNISISTAFIGFASKDFSSVAIENLETDNVNICLAAYQKKPEYGPGSIVAKKLNSSCAESYIREKGSSIKLSGYNVLTNSTSAYKDIYGID
mgnify:CR=1 FL=1|tara:strand:- start:7942 stop:10632 length:2691 start_codon:yes stop_codon:yes gene_type:complete